MTDGPQFPFQQQPQQQSQPPWAAEPDWEALAEESQSRERRRKLMMIGGGVLAIAVVGGIVAAAVVSADKKPSPTPTSTAAAVPSLPPETAFPSVAAPSPENPLDVLSSAAKDSAPLSAQALFPAKNLNRAGREYSRTNTAGTSSCSAAAASNLSAALAGGGCRQLFRATYARDDVAVTIGVAVFDTKAEADKIKNTVAYVRPLNGGSIADFCHAVSCRMTANSVGRYAYFTISGLKNNQSITAADTAAQQASSDVASVTFQLIVQRGRDEANARLTASPAS